MLALALLAPAGQAATAINSFRILPTAPEGFGNGTPSFGNSGFSEIAVDDTTGLIFLPSPGEGYVQIFEPDAEKGGTFLTQFDPFGSTLVLPTNIAVDSADESIYTGGASNGFATGIVRSTSDGQPTPTYSVDPSFVPAAPLVTPSGMVVDPVSHDLFVADSGAGQVFRLDNTGALVESFNGGGSLQSPVAVALSPAGDLYVVDAGDQTVKRFSSGGTAEGTLPLSSGAQPRSIAVDSTTGEVAVAESLGGEAAVEGFSSAGARLYTARFAGISGPDGVAWDSSGERLYLSAGDDKAYALTHTIQPGVDEPVVQSSGRDTAQVSTAVDPGGETTSAWLEYCLASEDCGSYASSDPSDPENPWQRGPLHTELGGSGSIAIEDELPLTSNQTWRLRTFAENDATKNASAEITFASPLLPPAAETGGVGSLTDTTAVLTGTIGAVGDQTTYYFEYGLTSAYGSKAPPSGESSAGDKHLPRSVSKPLSGLLPGTTYHYRLVARNSAGVTEGADRTFTTLGADETAPQRAYEQVTPVNKQGAQVNSIFHVQTAPDGSAIAVAVSASGTDAATAGIKANYLSRRTADGWLRWKPIDAPQGVMIGIYEASTVAVSADQEHALVVSNLELAPGGIAGGGNLYVKDLETGEYTFVGGAPGAAAYKVLTSPGAGTTMFVNAAPDFSWILFKGLVPLFPGAPPSGVYRWTPEDGLSLESLEPGDVVSSFWGVDPRIDVSYIHTTSDDGSIVYFGEANGGSTGPIYRRENGETTIVSHADGAFIPSSFALPAILDGVSPDGRYAVFHTASPFPLTADTPTGEYGVYRYDTETDEVHYLTSSGAQPTTVLGVSDDTETVYVDLHSNSDGSGPVVVWRNGDESTVEADGVSAPPSLQVNSMTAMSPNGRYFSWVGSDGKARLYDAETKETVCVSCTLDGSDAGIAHMRPLGRSIGNQGTRAVNDDGLMFFDSPAQLVADDHNGSRDVYAYHRGSLTLISPGNGNFDASFIDASTDGRDVFFETAQGLVGQDVDGEMDVYDARVGGGFASQSPPKPPVPCQRPECGGSASAPPADPGLGSRAPRGFGALETARPLKLVKGLTASDRAKLARGGKAQLRLSVAQPGTVTVTGSAKVGKRKVRVVRSQVRAREAGPLSVPISISKPGLAELRSKGALTIRLSIQAGQRRALSLKLKLTSTGKGGRS